MPQLKKKKLKSMYKAASTRCNSSRKSFMRSFMRSCMKTFMKLRHAKLLNNHVILIETTFKQAQPLFCRSFMTAFGDKNPCRNRSAKFHETSHETFHQTFTTCRRS